MTVVFIAAVLTNALVLYLLPRRRPTGTLDLTPLVGRRK